MLEVIIFQLFRKSTVDVTVEYGGEVFFFFNIFVRPLLRDTVLTWGDSGWNNAFKFREPDSNSVAYS